MNENIRNRVFINNIAVGKNISYSLKTNDNSVYRVTGWDQIEDIITCGFIRPKEGKLKGGHYNEVFWTKGGEKTFYYDKRPVLEVPASKIMDGQNGALTIDDLVGIWIFNEKENRYLNLLYYLKSLSDDGKKIDENLDILNDEPTIKR